MLDFNVWAGRFFFKYLQAAVVFSLWLICWLPVYLICLLMEAGRHLQQSAAFVQRRSKRLPLLFQLTRDLLDLLRGVVARLQKTVPNRHDSIDVHIHILEFKRDREEQKITEKLRKLFSLYMFFLNNSSFLQTSKPKRLNVSKTLFKIQSTPRPADN